jgi:hypothetical protein
MRKTGKAKSPRTAILTVVVAALAGCSKPLPGEGTPEAKLYRERCGTSCHQPVAPASMPYATWEMILPRMEQRIRASTQPPLGAEERTLLEAYLKKYSG